MEELEELINIRDEFPPYRLTPHKQPYARMLEHDVYFLFDDVRCIHDTHEEILDLSNFEYENEQEKESR